MTPSECNAMSDLHGTKMLDAPERLTTPWMPSSRNLRGREQTHDMVMAVDLVEYAMVPKWARLRVWNPTVLQKRNLARTGCFGRRQPWRN